MCFMFIPIWGNDPILRAYFSDGLKPPTSIHFAAPIGFSACFFDVVAAISLQNVLHNPPPPCEIPRGLEIQTNDFLLAMVFDLFKYRYHEDTGPVPKILMCIF